MNILLYYIYQGEFEIRIFKIILDGNFQLEIFILEACFYEITTEVIIYNYISIFGKHCSFFIVHVHATTSEMSFYSYALTFYNPFSGWIQNADTHLKILLWRRSTKNKDLSIIYDGTSMVNGKEDLCNCPFLVPNLNLVGKFTVFILTSYEIYPVLK